MQCRSAGHAVGRAFDQRVERQRRIQSGAKHRHLRRLGLHHHRLGHARRWLRRSPGHHRRGHRGRGPHVGARHRFTLGNSQLQRDALAIERLQQCGNAASVLSTNPIELEAIGHIDRDLGKVFRHRRGQGLNPSVELLLGQVLTELFNAGQPQTLACVVEGLLGHGGCTAHNVDRRKVQKAQIVAFQEVIHKSAAARDRAAGSSGPTPKGVVLWTNFVRSLQPMHNTEIIAGFPECVQGDMACVPTK